MYVVTWEITADVKWYIPMKSCQINKMQSNFGFVESFAGHFGM